MIPQARLLPPSPWLAIPLPLPLPVIGGATGMGSLPLGGALGEVPVEPLPTSASSSFVPFGVPQPVQASHPAAAE